MSYKDEYHPRAKADLKKLDKAAVREFFDIHVDRILADPRRAGGPLGGSLQGVTSYHFRKNKVEYRVAFAVEEESKTVHILMIGKRENFYEILKRRLR